MEHLKVCPNIKCTSCGLFRQSSAVAHNCNDELSEFRIFRETEHQKEIKEKKQRISALESELRNKQMTIENMQSELIRLTQENQILSVSQDIQIIGYANSNIIESGTDQIASTQSSENTQTVIELMGNSTDNAHNSGQFEAIKVPNGTSTIIRTNVNRATSWGEIKDRAASRFGLDSREFDLFSKVTDVCGDRVFRR